MAGGIGTGGYACIVAEVSNMLTGAFIVKLVISLWMCLLYGGVTSKCLSHLPAEYKPLYTTLCSLWTLSDLMGYRIVCLHVGTQPTANHTTATSNLWMGSFLLVGWALLVLKTLQSRLPWIGALEQEFIESGAAGLIMWETVYGWMGVSGISPMHAMRFDKIPSKRILEHTIPLHPPWSSFKLPT
jgi:hypothetical protein